MEKTKEQIMDELNTQSRARYAKAVPKKIAVVPISKEAETVLESGEKGAANLYGACSIEKFCDQGSLSQTHEDAANWLSGPWGASTNFWFQDAAVQPWIYYETYDNWQETYGIDAVRAFYHSGHGGMDGNGVFYLPVGAKWDGFGCTVVTDPNLMGLGNEKIRYIFWSTCVSCRVFGGQTPLKTWGPVHKGFRMLFGFETTSWDSPNYGKFFWDYWRLGKSLSSAWLDASWKIAHDMAPTVVACGATQKEASDRLFNERFVYPDAASKAWWWWRWYNVAAAIREPNLAMPTEHLSATLKPTDLSAKNIRAVLDQLGVESEVPESISAKDNITFSGEDDLQLAFGRDGSYEMKLAEPDRDNRDPIGLSIAKSKASAAVSRFDLGRDVSLVLDSTRVEAEGGSDKDATKKEGPYTTQTTVQFRQLINELPVITPGIGDVRISVDNNGSVTSLQSFVRKVETLNKPRITKLAPPEDGVGERPQPKKEPIYERALAKGVQELITSLAIRGTMPVQYTTVPGLTEVGYDIKENEASLAVRRAIEVDFGEGYLKRYWVIVPL